MTLAIITASIKDMTARFLSHFPMIFTSFLTDRDAETTSKVTIEIPAIDLYRPLPYLQLNYCYESSAQSEVFSVPRDHKKR
jgi:hypothetical protein